MGLEYKTRALVRTTEDRGDNVSSTRVLRSKPTHSGICRRKQLRTGCSHITTPRIQTTTSRIRFENADRYKETIYAQIEKELLASTWACEKFARYLVGLNSFTLHKPLITIINSQDLDKAPIRCQRLLMRLMRFSISAKYVPGKELTVADALSRTPLESTDMPNTEQEIVHVDAALETKPVSPQKLTQIKQETPTEQMISYK